MHAELWKLCIYADARAYVRNSPTRITELYIPSLGISINNLKLPFNVFFTEEARYKGAPTLLEMIGDLGSHLLKRIFCKSYTIRERVYERDPERQPILLKRIELSEEEAAVLTALADLKRREEAFEPTISRLLQGD